MALLPAIMSLFGGPSAPPAAAALPAPGTPPAGTAASQTAAAGANPTVPSQTTPASTGTTPAIPPAGTGNASPLDNYKDLWQVDPNSPKPASLTPEFTLDPVKLREAASKIDFVGHIPRELVAKALSGGEGAQDAFLAVITQASQLGYAQAAATSAELTRQSLGKAEHALTSSVLPNAMRKEAITTEFSQTNPIFQDPSVAPMLGMLQDRLSAKYPTATPKELAGMAQDYLAGISNKIVTGNGGTVVTKDQARTNRGGFQDRPETDWEAFFAN